jgi:ATP-dependent Clp protease ATP-binding subunit ClpB
MNIPSPVGQDNQQTQTSPTALEKYGTDFTQLARDGKLTPVIGRREEMRRIMQILERMTKNNPILIGEPGVGKTAIVEGLAQKIVQNEVPMILQGKSLISLNIGSLLAGCTAPGMLEERVQKIIEEIEAAKGEKILFIDEVHMLVGLNAGPMSDMLKPALARGTIRCIGATTIDEYKKNIEKDVALERRFQPVPIKEPSIDETISILRGLRQSYEKFHDVKISDSSIIAAVKYSARYIQGRFLPDKAIDLMDEAAAKLKMEIYSIPSHLDSIEDKVKQLQNERETLIREYNINKGDGLEDRIFQVEKKITDLMLEKSGLTTRWLGEKEILAKVMALKEVINRLYERKAIAIKAGDDEESARITFEELPAFIVKLKSYYIDPGSNVINMFKYIVIPNDVAEVVSNWTGIPLTKMLESEEIKLSNMEELLRKRVIGQDHAIEAVSDAIRRARAGIKEVGRPIGSFLFLGPTGVGKTELAKALAEFMFDSEKIIRLDMTEYQERHTVSRLIGSPPGYVGYDEGGQLTEAVKRNPYSLILLDEIEKAHKDVFNVLLQILDDGRLTDGQGFKIDFNNTVIIMTSNLGGDAIRDMLEDTSNKTQEEKKETMQKSVTAAMKSTFRPEFLNRVDEVVMFHPLSLEDIRNIVGIQVQRTCVLMLSERKLTVKITDALKEALTNEGFDPVYGARPLKRLIQTEIFSPLAKKLINKEIVNGQVVTIDFIKNKVVFL